MPATHEVTALHTLTMHYCRTRITLDHAGLLVCKTYPGIDTKESVEFRLSRSHTLLYHTSKNPREGAFADMFV